MKHPKGIRDVAEWYMSTVSRFDYVYEVFRRQCDFALQNFAKYYDAVGDRISVVMVTGTDFGTQNGPFMGPPAYRKLFQPFHRRMNDWVHRAHAVEDVHPHLRLHHGPDARPDRRRLQRLQSGAVLGGDMDPRTLKEKFGGKVTFWGGGVDTQKTLPFGTPEDVRRQVRERIGVFNPGGGFVFNTIHNVQAGVPVENLLAMYAAVREAIKRTTICHGGADIPVCQTSDLSPRKSPPGTCPPFPRRSTAYASSATCPLTICPVGMETPLRIPSHTRLRLTKHWNSQVMIERRTFNMRQTITKRSPGRTTPRKRTSSRPPKPMTPSISLWRWL